MGDTFECDLEISPPSKTMVALQTYSMPDPAKAKARRTIDAVSFALFGLIVVSYRSSHTPTHPRTTRTLI